MVADHSSYNITTYIRTMKRSQEEKRKRRRTKKKELKN